MSRESPHPLVDVYETEKPRFLGFVRRRLQDLAHLDEEDIVADVFSSLWAKADLLGEVENLVAYIYGALSHRIQDALRQRATARRDDGSEADDLPDPSSDVEAAMVNHQLRERLNSALQALSQPERAVWVATELHGQGFRELAEQWNTPIGTLLSRKSRASARLRILLNDYQP